MAILFNNNVFEFANMRLTNASNTGKWNDAEVEKELFRGQKDEALELFKFLLYNEKLALVSGDLNKVYCNSFDIH